MLHLDISGIEIKSKQPQNNATIEVILLVFHLEISGNVFKE